MRSHTVTLHCEQCNTAHTGHGPTREDAKLSAKRGLKECRRRHRLDDRRDALLLHLNHDPRHGFIAPLMVPPICISIHQNTPQGGDK